MSESAFCKQIIFAACLAVSIPAFPEENGVTLEETIEFINSKLEPCGRMVISYYEDIGTHQVVRGVRVVENHPINIFGEQLVVKTRYVRYDTSFYIASRDESFNSNMYEYRVPLEKLSTEVVIDAVRPISYSLIQPSKKYPRISYDGEARTHKIKLSCTKAECIQRFKDGKETASGSKLDISVCGGDTVAGKVQRALQHAIKISGGQEELF